MNDRLTADERLTLWNRIHQRIGYGASLRDAYDAFMRGDAS